LERKINAWQALKDILDGLDDAALMRKYALSRAGLDRLFDRLVDAGLLEPLGNGYVAPARKSIVVDEMVNDILCGMSDRDLMKRYDLSAPLLKMAQKKLLESGLVTQKELDNRLEGSESSVAPFAVRQASRYRSSATVTVRGDLHPEEEGSILDVSGKGIGTVGLPARVGLIQTLKIVGDESGEVEPFEFEGICRWTKRDDDGRLRAGFEIVDIDDESLWGLADWVRRATIEFEE
jgi:hypothetical protein